MKPDKSVIGRTGGNGRRSSCVAYNGVLHTSGITTVDLEADITGQAQDIFAQLDKLMEVHGTTKGRILSAQVCLQDMADYGGFNQAWDEWVSDGDEPAMSLVVAGLPLPEYRVQVSLIVAV